ncbi:heterokaryon incompatibility protein-domain-containing protein [Hyaloscypha finlandica]|nr:heterokaryon incompatibility protein-domain-containing protein [Hyaloscypha finlandica]
MISPATFDFHFVSDSISYCLANHGSSCRQQHNDAPNFFRVVDCKARQVVIAQPGCQYLALSYVWGSTTGTSARSLLDLDNCPKVINDSIDVTLKLMFQYLWVDRYCIDQLDETDKHHQIRQMDLIYTNAEATIIAAAGDGPGYGLPGVNGTLRKQQPHLRIHGHLLASTLPHPSWSISNSTWATRGWTYQENILSKRRIIFTDDQVLFECNSMHYAESQILPLDVLHTEDKTMFKSDVVEGAFKWKTPRSDPEDILHFLADFTKRELSYPADAINAMQGIFQMFSKTKYPVYHIEGVPILSATPGTFVPEHSFIKGLSWYHAIPGKRRPEFPSWSWAGWTGQVEDGFMCTAECPVGTALRLETEDGVIEKFPTWDHWLEFLSKKTTSNVKILHIQGWTLRCTVVHQKNQWGETGRDTYVFYVPEDGYILEFKVRKNKSVYLAPKWDLDVSQLDGKSLTCICLGFPTDERFASSLTILVVNQNMDGLSERVGCCTSRYVYVQADREWVDPGETSYWNMLKKELERRTIHLG